jgi:hypothetical protein
MDEDNTKNDNLVPDAGADTAAEASPIMRYFAFGHLPDGKFKLASIKCFELAAHMEATLVPGPEKTEGLRKLLEAKDCFVRAALPQD